MDNRQPPTRTADGASAPVRMIGDFRIVRKIGEGGMGVVFEAEQQHPRRAVALKVIRGGQFVDETRVRMFDREAQTLARLKHPGIAAIYESGATEDGEHYFAMELVHGETLERLIEQQREDPSAEEARERIALFVRICEAVSYAHQRGVIHRDLKPANIVVLPRATDSSSGQAHPQVKILDFGLARITDTDVATATFVTELGRVQGTLPYISPEQFRGNSDQIDLRTDVYSLGVILYEMLTSRTPFDVRSAAPHEVARMICEEPPLPLRGPSKSSPRFDADLQTIVLKALDKEPGRRYQSVASLAEDLDRYLNDQPILARPASAIYQLRKMVTRHRVGFAFASALLVLLVAFAVGMTIQTGRIALERDRANLEAETSLRVSAFLSDLFEVPDPGESRGSTITAREVLDRGAEKIRLELEGQPAVRARLMETMAEVYSKLGLYARAEALAEEACRIERELHPGDHSDLAGALLLRGSIKSAEGDGKEAERLVREALEMFRRIEREPKLQTASSLQALAIVLKGAGRLPEAEAAYREALALRRKGLGERGALTASTLTSLAELLRSRGNLDEAEAMNREALSILRQLYGELHPDVCSSLNNLALVLQAKDEYVEAERLLRQVVDMDRRLYGGEERHTASALNNLAALLQERGRFDESEALQRQSLAIRRKALGPDHPDVAANLNNLAVLLRDKGDLDEAERFIHEALDLVGRTRGKDHWNYGASLYNLAKILYLKKDYREAEARAREASEVLGKTFPESHPRSADLRSFLGDCVARQGRGAEAEPLLVSGYEALRSAKGDDDKATIKAAERLVAFYASSGRPADAEIYRARLPVSSAARSSPGR